MKRRTFIASMAAASFPALARAQSSRTLKFIPASNLRILDPVWTTAYTTRNHAYMVYDALYGQTGPQAGFAATPQMVEGHVVEDDGKTWKLSLRNGLTFHDGQRVLARDCVASVKRWGARDTFGQALMQRVYELSAPDDRTIVFRLSKPFLQLPEALGKWAGSMCAIMPERLASTDPFKQVTEIIGSGPFRFKSDERVQGSLFVYEKFTGYKPRESGRVDWTSGPKVVHFDRIEWHVIPDQATAAAALQSGEMDWWEAFPTPEIIPTLERGGKIKTEINDPTGLCAILRPNHLWPPFSNPAVRRALWGAIDQTEFMDAAIGTDPRFREVPVGFFTPGSPLANDAGMTALTGRRDYRKAKEELKAAGYQGEKVALLVAADVGSFKALSDVAAEMMTRIGMNIDYQAMDFGTVLQRQTKKDPPDRSGWNAQAGATGGTRIISPGPNDWLRCNGPKAFFGWPTSPKMESLREQWFDAPDTATQKKLAEAIQQQAFIDVPYYPLGIYFVPTAYRSDLTGVLNGLSLFWNVRRVG
jgi:peptide/nickel transport system substrate-binding protein